MRVYRVPKGLAVVTDWPKLAWESKYCVAEIAWRCGVTAREVRTFCRHRLGGAAKPWLAELRRAQAEALLRAGQQTKAVARALHYRDAPHFCRDFKRAHGLSPSGWLARHPGGVTAGPRSSAVRLPRAEPVNTRAALELDFPWLIPPDLLEVVRQSLRVER